MKSNCKVFLASTNGLGGGQWLGELLDMRLYLAGTYAEGSVEHRIGGLLYSTKENINDSDISGGNICQSQSENRGERLDPIFNDWRDFDKIISSRDDILRRRGQLTTAGMFNKPIASRVNLLESFYYIADWQIENLQYFKSFMLDSGAFTFAFGSGEKPDWNEYIESYIEFINEHDIDLFFELDIDSLVGYDKVKKIRKRIEDKTGKKCIPVWHLERGKDEWLRMCDEYDYVAIGGIAVAAGRKKLEPYIPWFTKEAHKRNTKVHGLGYTNINNLARSGFDSVDSSAWLYGNRGGFIYQWDGKNMRKTDAQPGQHIKSADAARHNFYEWVKMAEDIERQ